MLSKSNLENFDQIYRKKCPHLKYLINTIIFMKKYIFMWCIFGIVGMDSLLNQFDQSL